MEMFCSRHTFFLLLYMVLCGALYWNFLHKMMMVYLKVPYYRALALCSNVVNSSSASPWTSTITVREGCEMLWELVAWNTGVCLYFYSAWKSYVVVHMVSCEMFWNTVCSFFDLWRLKFHFVETPWRCAISPWLTCFVFIIVEEYVLERWRIC